MKTQNRIHICLNVIKLKTIALYLNYSIDSTANKFPYTLTQCIQVKT